MAEAKKSDQGRHGSYEFNPDYKKAIDYVQSPFRYPGGKFYALKYIVPFLNAYPHDEYREPFVGGGSVYFGKPRVEHNWINDLETLMIETYKAIQSPTRVQRLMERVGTEVANRERHSEVKEMDAKTKDDIAFKTYYLNRTSYSGIINKPAWGYEIGFSSPPPNWPNFLTNAHKKLKNVEITNIDFSEVLSAPAIGSNPIAYLDPPYFLADQKRAYTKSFVLEDHLRLEEQARKLDYAFVLSYDDCEEVRDLYSWANIYPRTWFYNTANSSGPRKIGKELLITNFKITAREEPQLKLL